MVESYEKKLEALGITVDDVVSALNLPVDPYTIFLSGSVIEGYGNTESDIDVYIIYAESLPEARSDLATETNTITLEYINDRRVDIESWTKQQVLAVAQRMGACPSGLDYWADCLKLGLADFEFAHNLRIGVPILHPEHFAALHQAFDYGHLSRILTTYYVYCYGASLEDASGAIASKQYGTALLTSRKALQYAVDALLASHGETNTKDKWRFFKLEKLADPALLERYWAQEFPAGATRDDIFAHAKQSLRLAGEVAIKAQKIFG
jgi:hypothetical protein